MSCECQTGGGIEFAQLQALAANDNNQLFWFVQGVRTGMQMHQAEQQKWTRLGVILALTFGTLHFLKGLDIGE